MKSIMLSVQPKWVEKIVNGEKTIEVRKNRPKIKTPFKCYIYETKGQYITYQKGALTKYGYGKGKVIGEFICDRIDEFIPSEKGIQIKRFSLLYESCLSVEMMRNYLKGKKGYGWHISELKIYDKPKEVRECWKSDKCPYATLMGCVYQGYCARAGEYNHKNGRCGERLIRPPMSWCYVEAL